MIRCEKVFEFPILVEKSDSISVKIFFFWRPPVFGLKNRLNFRAFREIPSQFSDKPCETDSRTMKIRVKVVCTYLTLSKKPPPPFPNPGYAPGHNQTLAKKRGLDLTAINLSVSYKRWFGAKHFEVNATVYWYRKKMQTNKMLSKAFNFALNIDKRSASE